MKTCATCMHWTPPAAQESHSWDDEDIERPHGRGLCGRITMIGDRARPVQKSELAHVEDGSEYAAELRTKGEFGCILWAAK